MSEYKYKDSGVAWIGQIPEHWDTIKIKYTSWLKGRIGWQGLTSDEYQDEGAYLITGTDFQKGRINWETCVHISEERFAEDKDIHIKEGDLLITKDGTVGKVAVAKDCPDDVSLNSGVMLIRNTGDFKYVDQYLYYTLLSDEFWNWYEMSQTGASTIRHLYQEQFYNFEFAYPPQDEQKRIATFLDDKIGEIDVSIDVLGSLVEELKKYKETIINEYILGKNNEYIVEKTDNRLVLSAIPEGYTLSRIKYVSGINGRIGFRGYTTNDLVDEGQGAITLSPSNIRDGKMDYSKCSYVTWEKYYESPEIMIEQGDTIMVKTGASYGKCSYIESIPMEATINPQLVVFKNITIDKRFFGYLMKTNIIQHQVAMIVSGGTIPTMSQEKMLNFYIMYPNIEKQEQIANALDAKCREIDELILEKEKLIAELAAYKKSLIFEVVTGKRKVV